MHIIYLRDEFPKINDYCPLLNNVSWWVGALLRVTKQCSVSVILRYDMYDYACMYMYDMYDYACMYMYDLTHFYLLTDACLGGFNSAALLLALFYSKLAKCVD